MADGTAKSAHLLFIDWMKAAGILLIVVGHVAARVTDWATPPIYPKQLGVAFFLFVMGYTLAGETRTTGRVLFNRLFEIYLFGFALALLMSALVYLHRGDVNESNYLPFFGGVNVLFNFFPANTTTWYIGTYLHILVVWALLLRGVSIRLWMLAASLALEVGARAWLIGVVGGVIPYMLLTNWATVCLLGMYFGQHRAQQRALTPGVAGILLLALVVGWHLLVRGLFVGSDFPWMRAPIGSDATEQLLVSVCVSFLYVTYTFLGFQAALALPAWAPVRFLARHTLVIFLAHMPVYYALRPVLDRWGASYGVRSLVLLLVCVIGLGLLSTLLHRMVRPTLLRDRIAGLAAPHGDLARTA